MALALAVAVAGGLGALARYGIGESWTSPWAIVAVNVAGSFLLGLVMGGGWLTAQQRTVAGVGFLGGFTTFSTFSLQVVLDVDAGLTTRAVLYVAASVALGIAAAAAGFLLARRLA